MGLDESVGGLSALVAILLFSTTTTSGMRLIARRKQALGFGVNDYLIIPAWLCFVGLSILAIYGMARQFVAFPTPHNQAILTSIFVPFIKVYYIADLFSVLTLGFVRLSALYFYCRVFVSSSSSGIFHIATVLAIIVITSWTLGFVFLQIFICNVHFDWIFDPIKGATCLTYPYLEGVGISSFILDVLVLIIPIPKIWTLYTSIRHKLAVTGVFLLALIGVAGSCARAVFFIQNSTRGRAANEVDVFLNNTQSLYYIIMEAGFCLTAVNLPSLWYFVSGTQAERIVRSVCNFLSIHSVTSASSVRASLGSDNDKNNKSSSGIALTQIYTVEVEKQSFPTRREEFELSTFNSKANRR